VPVAFLRDRDMTDTPTCVGPGFSVASSQLQLERTGRAGFELSSLHVIMARRKHTQRANNMPTKILSRLISSPVFLSALTACMLTVALYGDTLTLPLFSDDLVQIPWLETISWRELWSGPSPYGYYRPLWYTLWRVWGMLAGGLHPPELHLLNVVAHFVASWLVGVMVAELSPRDSDPVSVNLCSCASTAAFAAFPFSCQAIAWPGAVYNPLVSAMAAGALLAYDRGRRGGNVLWFSLALLLSVLAPLTYEAGLLLGGMVVLAEMLNLLSHRWSHRRRGWVAPFIVIVPLMFALWRAMRGRGVAGFGLTPSDLLRNIAYLVQGAIYPVAPLAQLVSQYAGLDTLLCLWPVAIPTLAFLIWSGLRRRRELFLTGAGWFLLFSLPPLVSMEAEWFALAPRFLYMTAGGVALVWGAALSTLLTRRRALTGCLLLALLLAPAVAFVRKGVNLHRMAGETIWEAAEVAPRGYPLLLVNLPMRITPRERLYPLGFEGVTPLPQRVTAEGLIYVHTGLRRAAEGVSCGIVATDEPPGYTYQTFGRQVGWEELAAAIRRSRTVYLTRYEARRIYLSEAGGPAAPSVGGGETLASFGERILLLKASGHCDPDGRVHLIAYWQLAEEVTTDATVFAHLLGPDGNIVVQADGYPLLGMFPFRFWERGEVMRDVHHFDPVPAGEYTIRLGVWDLATGKRWAAHGHPEGVVLLPVQCQGASETSP